MYTLQNTLYVMTQNAYAHLENNTVRIDVERQKRLQVPLHHIGSLVCFGNILISPALMHRLADEGKSLVLLEESGRFKARLEGPVSGNILLRQAHHTKAQEKPFALTCARAIIAGKLKNSRNLLLRAARETNDTADQATLGAIAQSLANSLRATEHAGDLDILRGIEGEAARQYFSALNLAIKPQARSCFAFNGRNRRPPLDPFNALLSFLYSLLMNDCRSALETVGLDPQLGFLHALRPGRAALALDLQEEFRAIMADRLALALINRGQLGEKDFDAREGGAVLLNDKGRRTVITAWQERKQDEVSHPLLNTKLPIGVVPFVQARLLARTVRGEMAGYLPYIPK
jgi:CRISPR-associated protein Cas1